MLGDGGGEGDGGMEGDAADRWYWAESPAAAARSVVVAAITAGGGDGGAGGDGGDGGGDGGGLGGEGCCGGGDGGCKLSHPQPWKPRAHALIVRMSPHELASDSMQLTMCAVATCMLASQVSSGMIERHQVASVARNAAVVSVSAHDVAIL